MAVPILRLNIDNNPRIIVKQDSNPIIFTGYTVSLIGSGATIVTGSGANWTIYSPFPTGFTTTWGNIVGDITNQTDLTDYVSQSISAATSGLTSSWNDLTDKPVFLDYPTVESFQQDIHTHIMT